MKKHSINKTYSLQKVNGSLQGKLSVDKKSHRKSRKKDIILVVISLLFAILIWLLGNGNADKTKDYSVRLDAIGLDHLQSATGLTVFDEFPEVTVRVQGKSRDLANIKAEDLKPYILVDTYKGQSGYAEFKIEILKNDATKYVAIEVFPASVSLYLDEAGEKEVPVRVDKAFDADTSRELEPVRDTLKLRGPKQELDKVSGVTLVVTNAHITQCQEYGAAVVYPTLTDNTGKTLNEAVPHVEKEPVAVRFADPNGGQEP